MATLFTDQLKRVIQDAYRSYYFYKSMLTLTTDPYWQAFIKHAMDDEKSHYEMLQQIYYMLTETYVQSLSVSPPCHNLKECAKKALAESLETTEIYKDMYLTVPIPQGQLPLFIAMMDKKEHAIRFSTIYLAH